MKPIQFSQLMVTVDGRQPVSARVRGAMGATSPSANCCRRRPALNAMTADTISTMPPTHAKMAPPTDGMYCSKPVSQLPSLGTHSTS